MPHCRKSPREELRRIYGRVAEHLASRSDLYCELSGRCCRFEEAGHELFLTVLEFDEMVRLGPRPGEAGIRPGPEPGCCPWLVDGLCANREGRALACRTYFCSDEDAAAEVTETWHARIRSLHERHGLRYVYQSLTDHLNAAEDNSSEGA